MDTRDDTLSRWLPYRRAQERPRLRLFCFPYAGGGASVFREWQAQLAADIELCAVQLPGREGRLAERRLTSMAELADRLAAELAPVLDAGPFAFYGVSMGARIAYRLAHHLRQRGKPSPRGLFLSACPGPRAAQPAALQTLSDDVLVEEVRRMGGTPPEVLAHPELLALVLPLLRADLTLARDAHVPSSPPLSSPLWVYGGSRDPLVPVAHLERWREETTGPCEVRCFDGDHFFFRAQQAALLAALEEGLWRIS